MFKDFKNNLSTIILCGGSGKRLYPLTKKLKRLADLKFMKV